MTDELISAFDAPERPRLRVEPIAWPCDNDGSPAVAAAAGDVADPSAGEGAVLPSGRAMWAQRPPDIFVLYLNADTWLGDVGEVLAGEVSAAREAGLRIVLLHENDERLGGCPFARFFQTTPGALIEGGIYSDIAVALHAAPYREVPLPGAAQAIGATNQLSQTLRVAALQLFRGVRLRVRGNPTIAHEDPPSVYQNGDGVAAAEVVA